jgi:acetyl esterase/lipase
LRSKAGTGATGKVQVLRDVAYYTGKDADPVRHKLDLYCPRDEKDFPVVLFVHGGAWMYGDKSAMGLYSAVGKFLAEHGIGAVLPNYRLSPWVKHPQHVRDVARAFAWTYRQIARHGGNPRQLFVAGHSAGGHLAALLATDDTYLRAEEVPRDSIRGVIAVSGVYRIPDKIALEFSQFGENANTRVTLAFNPFDLVFGHDPRVRADASPLRHVGPGLPPFLLVSAEHDLPLLPEMAAELARVLKENRCEVELLTIKDRRHTSVIFKIRTPNDPLGQALLAFVAKHRSDVSSGR